MMPFANIEEQLHTELRWLEQAAQLAFVGVSSRPGDRILTASLSAEAVAKLSEFPWIEQISLAKKRRPL
jgi:hypothetical protein